MSTSSPLQLTPLGNDSSLPASDSPPRHHWRMLLAVLWIAGSLLCQVLAEPIRLHPDNPHYFLFRGKPTVLVTSAEHYGAVLNLDFDYVRYLKALQSNALNHTRVWPGGPYLEIPGSFNIANNTLAPKPDRFSSIWQRSTTPGYAGGGNKFDLTRWNNSHLTRLKDFVAQAGKQGIVVELSLFCPYYNDKLWDFSPFKSTNNVNNVGDFPRAQALTLQNGGLLAIQDAMVRKVVAELKEFDNLFYEICNEPYAGGVTLEWQHHIADVIREAESSFKAKHLIAQNIANGSTKVENPHAAVSVFNFHYSRPPESVALNYGLNKVIGLNETGFDGSSDATYRIQGWDFILAGGALYNSLDYSFTVDRPDGTFQPDPKTPGGGSAALRRQLQVLKDFVHGFDLVKMRPDASVIQGGIPANAVARVLAERGKAYAVYIHHGTPGFSHGQSSGPRRDYHVAEGSQQTKLELELPSGSYKVEWVGTRTGKVEKSEKIKSSGGRQTLVSPAYTEDIAVRVRRVQP